MSAVVKISPKLPGDAETNGLDSTAKDLISEPKAIRVGVLWYDVHHVTVDTDSGAHSPTIRLRRFEPLGDSDDVPQAVRDAVATAMESRTGRTPLPFEIVTVTEDQYGDSLELVPDE